MKLPVYSRVGDFLGAFTVPQGIRPGEAVPLQPVVREVPPEVAIPRANFSAWAQQYGRIRRPAPEAPRPPAVMVTCFEFTTGTGWKTKALQAITAADEDALRKGGYA